MAKAQEITMRHTPCNCGCKGTDWAHAKTLKRVVRNKQAVEPTDRSRFFVVETGTISVLDQDIAVERVCVMSLDGTREVDLGWTKVGAR